MFNSFLNKKHAEDVKDYLLIRERIDKVNSHTRRNDIQSFLALDSYTKDKSFKDITQDDMMKFEEYLEKDYIPHGRLKLQNAKKEEKKEKLKKPKEKKEEEQKKGCEKSTIDEYMIHIKRFYKYYFNQEIYKKGKKFQKNLIYPDNVMWISTNSNNQRELPLDKLISENDLLKLLNKCDNYRDKAMFSAGFYDAGLRISELISLNVGSVSFDKLGGYFILPKKGKDLKTGTRKISLFIMPSSTQFLKDFLNNHPFKDIDYAPLFYSRDSRVYSKVTNKVKDNTANENDLEKLRLSRPGIENNLRTLCKSAGIQDLTPHMLRHQSATLCSKKGFNEMELRVRYGWSSTSKMPSRYVHLASKDLDDKIKLITGFKEPIEPEKSKLITIVCWNCNEENVPTNKFCSKCSMNLNPTKKDIASALSDKEKMKNLENSVSVLQDMLNTLVEKQKEKEQEEILKEYNKDQEMVKEKVDPEKVLRELQEQEEKIKQLENEEEREKYLMRTKQLEKKIKQNLKKN
jgi:integrase